MSFSAVWTYNDLPVINADPKKYPSAARKANSWMQPVGPECGRGWILMTRADVLACKHSSSNDTYTLFRPHTLKVESTLVDAAGKEIQRTLEIQNAIILSAKVVARGNDDESTIMLVELVDELYFFDRYSYRCGDWNIRTIGVDPDYDGTADSNYYQKGLLKTWNEVCEELWTRCTTSGQAPFGTTNTWPDLPFTPTLNYPINFTASGLNAYRGLYALLRNLCCTLVRDMGEAWSFDCVRLGMTQSGLSTIENRWEHLRGWEDDPIVNGYSLGAEFTHVTFAWECDSDIPRYVVGDGDHTPSNDQGTVFLAGQRGLWCEAHSVPVASSPTGNEYLIDNADSVDCHYGTRLLFDCLPWDNQQYSTTDVQGTGSVDPQARALEVGKFNWDMGHWPLPNRHVYAGIIPEFTTGSEVRAVIWRNYGYGSTNDDGPKTEVIKYPGWPRPIYTQDGWKTDPYDQYEVAAEWPGPPDFLRINAMAQRPWPVVIVKDIYSWSDDYATNADGVDYFDPPTTADDLVGTTSTGQLVKVSLVSTNDRYGTIGTCDSYTPATGKTRGIPFLLGFHADEAAHPDGSGRMLPVYACLGNHAKITKSVVTNVATTGGGAVTSVTYTNVGTIVL